LVCDVGKETSEQLRATFVGRLTRKIMLIRFQLSIPKSRVDGKKTQRECRHQQTSNQKSFVEVHYGVLAKV
jgi:hypothetical protein